MLFNTLLKITIGKKEEEEMKEQSRDLHDDIRGRLPTQFLTPPDRAELECATKKPSIARIARYALLVYVSTLYMNYPRCGDCAFSASFVRECTDVS